MTMAIAAIPVVELRGAIPAGTAATVLRIEGVKLIVTPACVTAGAKE